VAIQPLDLQTMFTQMDKVGKLQATQKEGAAIQQSLQSVHTQKKIEEQVQSVDDAKKDENAENINEKNARKRSQDQNRNKEKSGAEDNERSENERQVFKDPSLGKNIDLSG